MIERLIAGLRAAGLEPTAREIADALWLAAQMERADIAQQPPGEQSISPQQPISPPQPLSATGSPQERAGPGAAREPRTSVFPNLGPTFKAGGLPFRSPTATALPGRLALGRALRPFKRRVLSRIQVELDEEATAEQIGRGLRPVVVVRPAPTRWLDLALVVDAAASMTIWQQSVAELRALLVQCGAFRDVRVYQLVPDEEGPVTLFAGMPGALRRPVGERELCDPSGRRLILIVSDCVSSAWSDGRVFALVREWGSRGPTAVLQMLPERLWERSALGDAPRVRLKASSPGVRNTNLQVESRPWALTKDAAIALPLVELDAPRVAAWAAMVVGGSSVAVSGVMLGAAIEPDESMSADLEADEPTADERVARFLSMATAGAHKLAVLFAAAPLVLPVMRIIRETMAPETTLGHFAEVFLGGLLREASEEDATDPDHVAYDFWPGVRERLLDFANAGDAMRVLEEASAYLTEHLGSTVDFRALLADPAATGTGPVEARDRPFATIGAEVLRRLGGEYKRLAERLDSALARAPDAPTSRRRESFELGDIRGRLDFGLLTTVEEELDVILRLFPTVELVQLGDRLYWIGNLLLPSGGSYRVGVTRVHHMGSAGITFEVQRIVVDLEPKFLLLVGIAGGVASEELFPGDVIVAERTIELEARFEARNDDGRMDGQYRVNELVRHPDAEKLLMALRAMLGDERLADWSNAIAMPLPPLASAIRPPRVSIGTLGTSNWLIKDADTLRHFSNTGRVLAVEMEGASIHRATSNRVPLLSIHGVSDIIGLDRHADWTRYACHTAAAFALAFLRARPVVPLAQSTSDPAASMASVSTSPDLPSRPTRRNPAQARSGAADPTSTVGAEASIDVVGSENGHWILVDGTDDFRLPQHHLDLAEALGTALARAGFSLITLGGQGVAHVVARAFMAALRRRGYSSGIYRMLHVVPDGQRPDFQSGGRELPTREPQVGAALARTDAVLRIGLSGFNSALLEGLERAGMPYLTLSEPMGGPPITSYARFAADQISNICARLNVTLEPSRHESLYHQVAIALDQPELATYERSLAEIVRRARTEVSSETALQLVGDRRRPSHRLVGYSVASTLSLDALIAALVSERWTVRSFRETRPLRAALQAVRAVTWPADAGQARVLAAAASSIQIELESDERIDPGEECKVLLRRTIPQNQSMERAADILEISHDYEFIRATMTPGDDRTVRMTDLVENARRFRQDPVVPEAEVWFTSGREGQRIVAIALLLGDPEPAGYRLVEDAIRRPLSAFEQYTAMRVTLRLLDYMEASQLDSLRDALEFQRGPGGLITRSDESRWSLSTAHLERIGKLRELSPSEVLTRTADRYMASGEQRGRRGDLVGAEEDYARALGLYTRVQDDLGLANVHAARSVLRARGTDGSGANDSARSDELQAWPKDRLPTPADVRVADVRPEHERNATPTDADMRMLLRSGDTDSAFRLLFRAHADALHKRALVLTRSAAAAEDMVQETLLAAFKNPARMLEVKDLRGWLLTILTRMSLDAIRAAKKHSHEAELLRSELIDAEFGDESADLLNTLSSEAERRALEECLATLDPEVAAALLMRYRDGLDWESIARALGVPVDVIRMRVQRNGLRQLRHCLTRKGVL